MKFYIGSVADERRRHVFAKAKSARQVIVVSDRLVRSKQRLQRNSDCYRIAVNRVTDDSSCSSAVGDSAKIPLTYWSTGFLMEKTTVKDTNSIVCTHSTFFCTPLKKTARLPYRMHPVAYKLHTKGDVCNIVPFVLQRL